MKSRQNALQGALTRQRRRHAWGQVALVLIVVAVALGVWTLWHGSGRPTPSGRSGSSRTQPGRPTATLSGQAAAVDGDTLDIRGTRVRLFGIDAPEHDQTCRRAGKVYPCGQEAVMALRGLLGRQSVSCQKRDTDRYAAFERTAGLIIEIFELLEALELISGRAACQQMTAADFTHFESLLQAMDGMTTDLNRWSQANVHLHQFICDCAAMPLVKSTLNRVLDQWNRLRSYYLNDVFAHRVQAAQEEHWQMYHAMHTRDEAWLERIVSEHNRAARAAYSEHFQRALQEAGSENKD